MDRTFRLMDGLLIEEEVTVIEVSEAQGSL
jgi:hypothetical protein